MEAIVDPLLKLEIDRAFGHITYRPYRIDGVRIILIMLFRKQIRKIGESIESLIRMVDEEGVVDSIDDISLFFTVLERIPCKN